MSPAPVPGGKLLLDTNLFLLMLFGLWKRERIARFKRLEQFTVEDFDLLARFSAGYGTIVTTPHVLTEVSNLTGKYGKPERKEVFKFLALLIPTLEEHPVPAGAISEDPVFARLGLTDVAIAQLARRTPFTVATVDVDLYLHLDAIGVTVVNFNHVKQAEWAAG